MLAHEQRGDQEPAHCKEHGDPELAQIFGQHEEWRTDGAVNELRVRKDDHQRRNRAHTVESGPYELYDMQADPRERFNLFGQPGTVGIQAELAKQLDQFFARYADPKYDIWKGGTSKAKRLSP